MSFIDFTTIVNEAWQAYDDTRKIVRIEDISAQVSTNHVYRITFTERNFIVAKLTYFGKYEHFVEDHAIINSLSNNLPAPFENFLSRPLMKGGSLFVHRFQNQIIDAWVVFYRPIQIKKRLPKRLDDEQIEKLGEQMGMFHKACTQIKNTLPQSSKTLKFDIDHLLRVLETDYGKFEHRLHENEIRKQCDLFLENREKLSAPAFDKIPVFIDWNIGNFSVTSSFKLFSRWDYDWFRLSTRMMDFYFFSRVVSDVGDRTVFSYVSTTLMEERFIRFLKAYHAAFPLTIPEILFLKEAYRFFILNYVVKDGRHFFHEIFATKLQKEAYDIYFPSLNKTFNADKIITALNL